MPVLCAKPFSVRLEHVTIPYELIPFLSIQRNRFAFPYHVISIFYEFREMLSPISITCLEISSLHRIWLVFLIFYLLLSAYDVQIKPIINRGKWTLASQRVDKRADKDCMRHLSRGKEVAYRNWLILCLPSISEG
jgi:hypothetical protein